MKSSKEKKNLSCKETPMRLSTDFSSRCCRPEENGISSAEKRNCQPRTIYPVKLSFKNEGEIKTFHNKQKLRKFITLKPTLHKMLKGIM